jgi:2-polyprenyl-6-methoxyphenol hydroxylase-like FAD-dependent oxidoreductase
MFSRTGYDVEFCDRQILLKTLFDNIEDKSKILLNKNVSAVEHSLNGVKVRCEDGSSYNGHVLAGADGVTSKTREEMWRLADSTTPGLVSQDKACTCCPYKVFAYRTRYIRGFYLLIS